jgi:hypothetical protein
MIAAALGMWWRGASLCITFLACLFFIASDPFLELNARVMRAYMHGFRALVVEVNLNSFGFLFAADMAGCHNQVI